MPIAGLTAAPQHAAKNLRWLGTGLLLAGALLGCALFLLAYEGCIIYQLTTSPNPDLQCPARARQPRFLRRQLHPAVG